jgi:hypothetical protein
VEFSGSNTIHHLNFQPQVLDFSKPIDSSIIFQALLHSSSGRPNAWPDECAEAAMGQGVILVLLLLVFILVCLVCVYCWACCFHSFLAVLSFLLCFLFVVVVVFLLSLFFLKGL